MIEPFYQHDGITIYNGDCREIMPQLPAGSINLVCTDPPFFKVKSEWWDNQWEESEQFLSWTGENCQEWRRLLAFNGSLYVFASPQMSWGVEGEIRKRFNVLNRITWRKAAGKHLGADKAALRGYFPQTETIIFAEQFNEPADSSAPENYRQKCDESARDVFGKYITQVRETHGLTMVDLTAAVGAHGKVNHGGACSNWERGFSIPTALYYERLQAKYPGCFDRSYEDLKTEYEQRKAEFEQLRRPFNATPRRPFTDVWDFETVKPSKHKHPCQKPLEMMEHIILTSTREGDTVLDCFGGSMQLAQACRDHGRQFIGIEIEKQWCEVAVNRLVQGVWF